MRNHQSSYDSRVVIVPRYPPSQPLVIRRYVDANGGLTGGWSEYDHGVFLRERLRHRTPAAAVTAATAKLVGHEESDVAAHEAWYVTTLSLSPLSLLTLFSTDSLRSLSPQDMLVAFRNDG